MIGAVISGILLFVVLYFMCKHEGDYDLPKVILICIGVVLVDICVSWLISELVGGVAAIALLIHSLYKDCGIGLRKSMLVVLVFFVTSWLIGEGVDLALSSSSDTITLPDGSEIKLSN